jgi:hypothetical protein
VKVWLHGVGIFAEGELVAAVCEPADSRDELVARVGGLGIYLNAHTGRQVGGGETGWALGKVQVMKVRVELGQVDAFEAAREMCACDPSEVPL